MLFKLFLIGCISYVANANTILSDYIRPADKSNLLHHVVKSLILSENDDYTASYYAAKTFKLVNEPIVLVLRKDNCAHLKKNYDPAHDVETTFHALSAWQLLSCDGTLHTDATIKTVKSVLDDGKSSIADIRYGLELLKLLSGQNVAAYAAKLTQIIQSKLKEDDSVLNYGHGLHAGAILGTSNKLNVADILAQADEIDGKLLQFEGGLTTTSLILTGILRSPATAKSLTSEQAEKFASYLLSRRTVQTFKGVLALHEAAYALTSSTLSPVSITVEGSPLVTLDQPNLTVKVSDILGKPLTTLPGPIVVQSASRVSDDVIVLSKQPLTPGTKPTEYVLKLASDPGEYRVVLTAGASSQSVTLTVRILGSVRLDSLEIGLTDTYGDSVPRLQRLQSPSKLTTNLQADSSQHLLIKFALERKLHQTFLRLYSGKKEIIFVAEPESSGKNYKLEVNLSAELAQSGTFEMELILGDPIMLNPIRWVLGGIDINLGASAPEAKIPAVRGPKPEITHLFRAADKRPPEAVSLLFTGLTAAPLLVLLILWAKIGINFGNFTTLSIPFHLGFGGILGLFTLFWLQLDMFVTCAWLIPIGGFTFIAGQRLLSHIANQKKP